MVLWGFPINLFLPTPLARYLVAIWQHDLSSMHKLCNVAAFLVAYWACSNITEWNLLMYVTRERKNVHLLTYTPHITYTDSGLHFVLCLILLLWSSFFLKLKLVQNKYIWVHKIYITPCGSALSAPTSKHPRHCLDFGFLTDVRGGWNSSGGM
jgi:hypothetical protein